MSLRSTHRVHVLVAHAFLEKPKGAECVMHIDNDKTNNKSNNLRFGSYLCNMAFQVDYDTFVHGEKVS